MCNFSIGWQQRKPKSYIQSLFIYHSFLLSKRGYSGGNGDELSFKSETVSKDSGAALKWKKYLAKAYLWDQNACWRGNGCCKAMQSLEGCRQDLFFWRLCDVDVGSLESNKYLAQGLMLDKQQTSRVWWKITASGRTVFDKTVSTRLIRYKSDFTFGCLVINKTNSWIPW